MVVVIGDVVHAALRVIGRRRTFSRRRVAAGKSGNDWFVLDESLPDEDWLAGPFSTMGEARDALDRLNATLLLTALREPNDVMVRTAQICSHCYDSAGRDDTGEGAKITWRAMIAALLTELAPPAELEPVREVRPPAEHAGARFHRIERTGLRPDAEARFDVVRWDGAWITTNTAGQQIFSTEDAARAGWRYVGPVDWHAATAAGVPDKPGGDV